MMQTIIEQARELHPAELRILMAELKGILVEKRHEEGIASDIKFRDLQCAAKVKEYMIIMCAIMETDEVVLLRSRIPSFAAARTLIAYALFHEHGFSQCSISRVMGKDHATTWTAVKRAEYALAHPVMYDDYISIWKQFNEIRNGNIHKETDGDPLQV